MCYIYGSVRAIPTYRVYRLYDYVAIVSRGGSDGPAAPAMAGPHFAAEMGVALPIVSAHAYKVCKQLSYKCMAVQDLLCISLQPIFLS